MASNLNLNDSNAAAMEDISKRRRWVKNTCTIHNRKLCFIFFISSRSIKRRKFDDELVESSLGAAFGSPLPKTQRSRTQSLNMTSTNSGLYFYRLLLILLSYYHQSSLMCIIHLI